MVALKYLLIAKNNIKRAKAASMTLILLVAIATIFLYVGINVLSQIGSFIDEKNTVLNGAHEIIIADRALDDKIKEIYEGIDGFAFMQKESAIMFGAAKLQNLQIQEDKFSMPVLFLQQNVNRDISKLDIIDPSETKHDNSVLVPYVLKVANGYKTGDKILLYVDDESIEFIISGFYEDVMFASSTNLMLYKFYVLGDQFNKLENQSSAIKCRVNLAILDNVKDSTHYENQMLAKIKNEITDTNQIYMTSNYLSLKTGTSVFIMIIMSVLIAFSGIILVVSLIVIRFSTSTHIENNIKNIGTMEACGYTPKQLLYSILLEYTIIGGVGVALGILLSLGITPVVTGIVSSSIGLKWIARPSIMAAFVSFMIIIFSILFISYACGRKIKEITPLTALRSGIETHNFKKSRIPLDKTRVNINLAISLKEFLYNKRQNMVASIIIMMLSVVCILALAMYYNFVVDNTSMMHLVGIENAQIEMVIPSDTKQIFEEVQSMKEVKKTVMLEGFETTITHKGNQSNPHFQVTRDYSELQVNTLIKGRMPMHDNEISMTSLILNELDAKVGDTVTVQYKEVEREFLIVGMTQHISYLGKGAEITTGGMERLVDGFEGTTMMIYLKEGVDTDKFITKLNSTYEEQGVQLKNNKETLDKMMISFKGAIRFISIGCLFIAATIIMFIMFLIVRARILKEKMHMGISKALGFTSVQLMGHILMSQIPVIVISAIVGAIAGYYLTNPMIAMSLASNGILKCNFVIPVSFVYLTSIAISILGFLTVIVVSLQIINISPIKMLEQTGN